METKPGTDGGRVSGKLRAHESARGRAVSERAKIVTAACLGDKDHVLDSFYNGCDDHISKPYPSASVLKGLRRAEVIRR